MHTVTTFFEKKFNETLIIQNSFGNVVVMKKNVLVNGNARAVGGNAQPYTWSVPPLDLN